MAAAKKKSAKTQRDEVLRFALSLPEAWEDHPWNESVAKVGKKVFVFLGGMNADDPTITVKLTASHHEAMELPGCQPAGYGLGKSGWLTFALSAAAVDVVCDFIEESYRNIAPKKLVAKIEQTDAVSG
jgi:predicted DNA-binding protein (MmcQ/YjbR family)